MGYVAYLHYRNVEFHNSKRKSLIVNDWNSIQRKRDTALRGVERGTWQKPGFHPAWINLSSTSFNRCNGNCATRFTRWRHANTVPALIKPGKNCINLAGGDPAWGEMNVCPENVTEEFLHMLRAVPC